MKEKETSKLYNSITNVNNQFIEEAQTTKKNKNNWIKWVVTAAACLTLICVVAINYLPHTEDDIVTTPGVADAPPMVCVNGKLYKQSIEQVSYDEIKSEFIYLGKIESDVTNSQTASTNGVPKENFQANHPIVGAEVYQYNVDIGGADSYLDSGLRRQPQPPPAVVYRIVDGPAALPEGL